MDQKTKDNQFIPTPTDNGADLFSELGSELDFGELTRLQETMNDGKKSPLQWMHY